MRRLRGVHKAIVVATAIALLALAAPPALGGSGTRSGGPITTPHPVKCSPAPCEFQSQHGDRPAVMANTVEDETTMHAVGNRSSHVVNVGEMIEVSFKTSRTSNGRPPAIVDPSATCSDDLAFTRKTGNPRFGPGEIICTYRAVDDTSGQWFIYSYGGADAEDSDYYAITADFELAGRITRGNAPLAGAAVRIAGGGGTRTVATDDSGRYSAVLPRGRYKVTPQQIPGVKPASRTVELSGHRRGVDFAVPVPTISLAFDQEALSGDSLMPALGEVTVKSGDDPLGGQNVRFGPPLDYSPPGLLCYSNDNLLWPGRLAAPGGLDTLSFERKTNDTGTIPFKVWLPPRDVSWLLEISDPAGAIPADSKRVTVTAGTMLEAFPDSFSELIQNASAQSASFSPASKDVDLVQREILDWLAQLKSGTAAGGVGGVLNGDVRADPQR